jgi:hypothetical protein
MEGRPGAVGSVRVAGPGRASTRQGRGRAAGLWLRSMASRKMWPRWVRTPWPGATACSAHNRGRGHLGGSGFLQLANAAIEAAQHVLDQHNVALQVGY